MHTMAARSGRPISISVAQSPVKPDMWRTLLDRMSEATRGRRHDARPGRRQGRRPAARLRGHAQPVHVGAARGRSWLPCRCPSASPGCAGTTSATPCSASVGRATRSSSLIGGRLVGRFDLMFPLGDPPNYEPDPSTSVAATAAAQGRSPAEVAYDLMLADDGRGLLYLPVAELRRRHARRRPRPARPPGVGRRAVRRRRPRRHDLRRQLPDHAAAVVGPRPPARPAAGRAARAQADAGDGRDGRPARPRPARRRATAPTSTSSTSTACACTRRSSPTTCRPAAGGCCSAPTATSTRSSPAPRSAPTASRPAPRRAASSAAPTPERPLHAGTQTSTLTTSA